MLRNGTTVSSTYSQKAVCNSVLKKDFSSEQEVQDVKWSEWEVNRDEYKTAQE